MSAGPRSGANHGAIMQMSGTISPPHEITYTPTTHRISKAKKGKKVHACEYPGCTKVCMAGVGIVMVETNNTVDIHASRASKVRRHYNITPSLLY